MAQLTRAQLKALWITGYIPTQADFANLFDSILTLLDPNQSLSQYSSTVNVLTPGANIALDWDDGNVQSVVLAQSTTFTFANPLQSGRYIIVVEQGGAGSYTILWPGAVLWPGGTPPTLTTTVGKVDIVTFVYAGSNYYGGINLNY